MNKIWTDYLYWQKIDNRILKNISGSVKGIDRNGLLEGICELETLKHRDIFIRRIDQEEYIDLQYLWKLQCVENGLLW